MFFGKHQSRVIKGKAIPLPKKFHPGKVEQEKNHLIVIPETTGNFIFLTEDEIRIAEIKEDVLLVGHGFYYTIWNPEKFKEDFLRKGG